MISITFPNDHLAKLKKHILLYLANRNSRMCHSLQISNHPKFKAIIIKLNLIWRISCFDIIIVVAFQNIFLFRNVSN
jgi:hypothetical protein